jgi:hypothetical protein
MLNLYKSPARSFFDLVGMIINKMPNRFYPEASGLLR